MEVIGKPEWQKATTKRPIKTVVAGGSKLKGSALNKELSLLYDNPVMIEITWELISSMLPMDNRKQAMDHDVDFTHAENAHNRIKGSDLMVIPTASYVIPLSSGYPDYVMKKQS